MVIERKLGKKFWKMVDWAAGTSTGAILACALARG
jgi:patatin-like phospholipase/acyl hydrolase